MSMPSRRNSTSVGAGGAGAPAGGGVGGLGRFADRDRPGEAAGVLDPDRSRVLGPGLDPDMIGLAGALVGREAQPAPERLQRPAEGLPGIGARRDEPLAQELAAVAEAARRDQRT